MDNLYTKAMTLILMASLIFSCKPEYQHQFTLVKKDNNKKEYDLKFNSEKIHMFHEMEFLIPSSKAYSFDSIESISYNTIQLGDFESLRVVDTKKEIRFYNEKKHLHTFSYPSHLDLPGPRIITSLTNSKSEHIELLKYEFIDTLNYKDKTTLKILGYSNNHITDHEDFDWELFLTNKKNLFNASLGPLVREDYIWSITKK